MKADMLDFKKASDEMSDLELKIITEHLNIEVIWCRIMDQEGEWLIDSHKHHSFEFHFCASGSSRILLEEKACMVKENEFYVTRPGTFHKQWQGDSDHYREYALNCSITLLDEKDAESISLMTTLQQVEKKVFPCKEIIQVFHEAFHEVLKKDIGYYQKILSLITLILIESIRALKNNDQTYVVPKKMKGYEDSYLLLLAYLKEHLSETIKMSDLVEHFHMSEKQINRLIQIHHKMTFKQLYLDMKMNKAKELLSLTQMQVNEIADILGYSSVHYFNQLFKKLEKATPTEFRHKSRKG